MTRRRTANRGAVAGSPAAAAALATVLVFSACGDPRDDGATPLGAGEPVAPRLDAAEVQRLRALGYVDEISPEEYEAIARMIGDEASPVGIDAKKTHIIIIHKLLSLERRLERLERGVDSD